MTFGLRNWRPQHLLGAWAAYWVVLFGVTLGPAALKVWQVANGPEHGDASVSANFGDNVFHLDILVNAKPAWTGSMGAITLALLIAGPPLALWVAWLASRPSRAVSHETPRLPEQQHDFSAPHRHREDAPVDVAPRNDG